MNKIILNLIFFLLTFTLAFNARAQNIDYLPSVDEVMCLLMETYHQVNTNEEVKNELIANLENTEYLSALSQDATIGAVLLLSILQTTILYNKHIISMAEKSPNNLRLFYRSNAANRRLPNLRVARGITLFLAIPGIAAAWATHEWRQKLIQDEIDDLADQGLEHEFRNAFMEFVNNFTEEDIKEILQDDIELRLALYHSLQ